MQIEHIAWSNLTEIPAGDVLFFFCRADIEPIVWDLFLSTRSRVTEIDINRICESGRINIRFEKEENFFNSQIV